MIRFISFCSYGKILACLTICTAIALLSEQLYAQAGLRKSLERLDKNENEVIEPDEITPLARPYLEQIMTDQGRSRDRRGISFQKPVPIERFLEAARTYQAFRNGVLGRNVRPESKSTVKEFGLEHDEPLIPEFGLPRVRLPYAQDDIDEADRTLRRYDDNRDGSIDREEAADGEWTHRNPFDDDVNKDDRLTRLELSQYFARRRLLSDSSNELLRKARQTGGEIQRPGTVVKREGESQRWRQGGNTRSLTASMLERFDTNKNGLLEFIESERMGIPLGRIDLDRDGEVTRDELQALVTKLQEEAGDLTEGLPGWFYELDADRDGQVEMAEFSSEWTDEKILEFASFDINDDGLLTSAEILKSKAIMGGNYRNEHAEVLPPHKTIISEIEVDEGFLIRDLNVQISITHTYVGALDAYLTGPNGQRVELFSEDGGSGDHFEQTVFDDQAGEAISKGKSPYQGSFRPKALDKNQPGLSSFNDTSVKGIWQLVVRGTRSDRFGMLHSWGLTVIPQEDSTISAAKTSEESKAVEAPTTNSLLELVK